MKDKKYSLTVSSDNKDVLEQFHLYVVQYLEQQCLICNDNGEECFYPDIGWNHRDRKDLNLTISCDFKRRAE